MHYHAIDECAVFGDGSDTIRKTIFQHAPKTPIPIQIMKELNNYDAVYVEG